MKPSFNQVANQYNQHAKIQGVIRSLLLERLSFLKLQSVNLTIVDAGCGTGLGFIELYDCLMEKVNDKQEKETPCITSDISNIKLHLIGLDASAQMLEQAQQTAQNLSAKIQLERKNSNGLKQKIVNFWNDKFEKKHVETTPIDTITIDTFQQDLQKPYENIADHSVDIIFSNLALQWCDDLNAVFQEWNRILKPHGVILCSTLGVDTFKELRFCGLPTRDFVDLHDVGDLLIHNGFINPVLEAEKIIMQYQTFADFLKSLRGVGANFSGAGTNTGLNGAYWGKKAYQKIIETYEKLRLENQKLPVTYEAILIHAWKRPISPFSIDLKVSNGQTIKTFPLQNVK